MVEAVATSAVEAELVWHGDDRLPPGVDAVVLPGGFAHGDYLRTGAIARFSPDHGRRRATSPRAGGPVLGICNGFQILCEAGLLPGALQKNAGLKFLCTTTEVVVETTTTPVTSALDTGDVLRLPINHFEGNYTCSPRDVGGAGRARSGRVPLRGATRMARSTTSPGCATGPATSSG